MMCACAKRACACGRLLEGLRRRFCEPTRRRAGRLAAWPVIIFAWVSLSRRAFEGERESRGRDGDVGVLFGALLDLLDELDPVELVVAAGVLVDDALHVERRREAGRLDAVGRVPDRDEAGELRCRVLFIRGREAARDGGEDAHARAQGREKAGKREVHSTSVGEGGGRGRRANRGRFSPPPLVLLFCMRTCASMRTKESRSLADESITCSRRTSAVSGMAASGEREGAAGARRSGRATL